MILSRKDFYLNKNSLSFYCKIPKISPKAYIFKGPFLRGLLLKGLIFRGKFVFLSRLGKPYSWKEIYRFALSFYFVFEGNFQVHTSPRGGLIFGGAI